MTDWSLEKSLKLVRHMYGMMWGSKLFSQYGSVLAWVVSDRLRFLGEQEWFGQYGPMGGLILTVWIRFTAGIQTGTSGSNVDPDTRTCSPTVLEGFSMLGIATGPTEAIVT